MTGKKLMQIGFHDYACSISDIESKATNLGDIYLSDSNFEGYRWSLNSMIDLIYRKMIFAILFESGTQIYKKRLCILSLNER